MIESKNWIFKCIYEENTNTIAIQVYTTVPNKARDSDRPPSGPYTQHSMARRRGENTATQQVHMVLEVDFHLACAHAVIWPECLQLTGTCTCM